ncbi:MAG: SLC13 family permease [Peptococcaceae bacterium]|nr:SLC13 family permease [Peptococcaceae bacterium]
MKNRNLQAFLVFAGIVAVGWTVLSWLAEAGSLGEITTIGIRVLAVCIGVAYAWTVTNEIWPSLMCFLLLPLTAVQSFSDVLLNERNTEIILFFILLCVFLKFLEEREVGRFLAAWMLGRKFLRGRPWLFLFSLFLAAYVVSSLINMFVGIYLMWGISTSISRALGNKPYEKFPTLLGLGVSIMGAMSLSAMPWGGSSLVLLTLLPGTASPGHSFLSAPPDVIRYVLFTVPLGVLTILVLLFLFKFLFRLDVSGIKRLDPGAISVEDRKMNPTKAVALISLLVFVALMLSEPLLANPAAPGVLQSFSAIGKLGKLILILVLLSMVRVDRQPIFNFTQVASRGMQWNLVAMLFIAVPLGQSLFDEKTGICDFLTNHVAPLFQGIPVLGILAILAFVMMILTNFIANIPVCMLMLPVAFTILENKGISLELVGFFLIVLCCFGWMTPSSSAAGMVMSANKDWLRTKDVVIYSWPILIVMTAVTILYCFCIMRFPLL